MNAFHIRWSWCLKKRKSKPSTFGSKGLTAVLQYGWTLQCVPKALYDKVEEALWKE